LERAGAVGDTSARFFDAEGHAVASTLEKRVVGLTLPQMTQIPTRLVIAHGSAKVTALHSALTGGLATHLVTDVATARTLLGEAGTDSV
jgi:lsr operon transcriptional repressor